jgi:hypothetical protein
MGLPKASEAVPDPLPNGEFWTTADPGDSNRRLRPSWQSWSPNEAWQGEVVRKIIAQPEKFYQPPGLVDAKEFFASLQDVEIQKSIQTYWTTLHNKWLIAQKSSHERSEAASINRRKARKNAVSHSS